MRSTGVIFLAVALGLVLFAGGGARPVVDRLADAIAWAEGFYVRGSRPERNHNPGNLTDDFGFPTIGQDGPFPIFATAAAGWAALKRQIEMMFDGSSAYYDSGMTIAELGAVYTATQQTEWALNVATRLGVPTTTRLIDL